MENKDNKEVERIKCNWCENVRQMPVLSSYKYWGIDESHEEEEPSPLEFTLQLTTCPECSHPNIVMWSDGSDYIIWPEKPAEVEGLPDGVYKEYKAAQKVKRISSNAYGVLVRRVLEKVCQDKGARGKDLFDKIENLSAIGEIPKNLADMAHQVRQLGNFAAHADLGKLTSSEVWILDSLLSALLEYIYAAPKKVAKVQERINELKAETKRQSQPGTSNKIEQV